MKKCLLSSSLMNRRGGLLFNFGIFSVWIVLTTMILMLFTPWLSVTHGSEFKYTSIFLVLLHSLWYTSQGHISECGMWIYSCTFAIGNPLLCNLELLQELPCLYYRRNISLRLSTIFEADASELLENIEEAFLQY